jgi:hypothetical protein
MKRSAKILLWTLGSIVALVVIFNVVFYLVNFKSIWQAALERRLCGDRLAQLQHDLPLGTSREDSIRNLDEHRANMVTVLTEGDNLKVFLGGIHKNSWNVCSHFDKYAVLAFTTDTSPGSVQEHLAHIIPRSVGECL